MLCSKTPPVYLFNKPLVDLMPVFPAWMRFDLLPEGYKESWRKAFDEASVAGIRELVELPNFDYCVFEEISGISQTDIEEKLK